MLSDQIFENIAIYLIDEMLQPRVVSRVNRIRPAGDEFLCRCSQAAAHNNGGEFHLALIRQLPADAEKFTGNRGQSPMPKFGGNPHPLPLADIRFNTFFLSLNAESSRFTAVDTNAAKGTGITNHGTTVNNLYRAEGTLLFADPAADTDIIINSQHISVSRFCRQDNQKIFPPLAPNPCRTDLKELIVIFSHPD
jgi:hypothetical protein